MVKQHSHIPIWILNVFTPTGLKWLSIWVTINFPYSNTSSALWSEGGSVGKSRYSAVISKSVFRYWKVPFYPTNIDNVSFYGKFIDIDAQYQKIYTDISSILQHHFWSHMNHLKVGFSWSLIPLLVYRASK